eukprot:1157204-Pelagomonas_calceolata.AAC.2
MSQTSGLGLDPLPGSQSQTIADLLQPPPVFSSQQLNPNSSQENDPVVHCQTAQGPSPPISVHSSATPALGQSFPRMPLPAAFQGGLPPH